MSEEQLKDLKESENVVNDEAVNNDSLVVEEKATKVVDGQKKKKKKSKVRNIIEWVLTGIFGVLFIIAGIGQIDGMVHAKQHYGHNIRFGYGSFLVLTESMEPKYKKNAAIITYNEDADKIAEEFKKNEEFNTAKTNAFIEAHPEAIDEDGKIIKDNADWKKVEKELKHIDITFAGVRYSGSVTPDDPTLNEPAYPNSKTAVPVTHRLREVHIIEGVEKGKGKYVFIAAGINEGAELYNGHQYQAFTEKEILGVVKIGSEFLGGFFRVLSSPWGLLIFLLIPALYLIITSTLDIFKNLKDPEPAKVSTSNSGQSGEDVLAGLSEEDKKRLKEDLLKEMMKGKDK